MAFLKLAFEKRKLNEGEGPQDFFEYVQGEHTALLESGKGGRYSYVAFDPFLVVWSRDGVTHYKKDGVRQILDGGPLEELRNLLRRFEYKGSSPVPFYGGAAGYFSYDFGVSFVDVKQEVFDDLQLPDYYFCFYNKVIAVDHQQSEVFYLALAETDTAAERGLKEIAEALQGEKSFIRKGEIGELKSNVSKEIYAERIDQIKDYLKLGDTYQVNYSQRYSADCTLDPWGVYKKLTRHNPSPFACYFEYPDFKIISASPELLLRKRKENIESWPIKGTVKRGKSEGEDESLVKWLLASDKEKAELNMIVDLVRNDLGRVCEVGSVNVDEHRQIQKYSHVIHTVSMVSGKLAQNKDVFDCIRSLFPGGSITGCPKKRTIEIIDKLEDYKRGIYTGSAGFINFSGDADFNILIRTMLLKDNRVYFNSGGGIVIDSDAEKEYAESVMKAQALIDILK